MPDNYIDYFEVGEYGDHFVNQVASLEGASPLVDIAALRERVRDAVAAVATELDNAGITRSGMRGGSNETTALAADLRDVIQRFFYFLRSLPKTTSLDLEAFFPGGNLGNLSRLKPADLLGRGAAVLRGFASHDRLDAITSWQKELSTAHETLNLAVGGKGGAQTSAVNATSALKTARQDFLQIYNRIAKRLVKAILIDLGREQEYRLFFLDLQVNEGPRSTGSSPENPDETDPPGEPD